MSGAKKRGKKGGYHYSFDKWHDYYLNKLRKLKLPNHVIKEDEELILIENSKRSLTIDGDVQS